MPLRALHDDRLTQQCLACHQRRDLPLETLQTGVHPRDPDATTGQDETASHALETPASRRLPPCARCGAVEVLLGAADPDAHPAPGSRGHRHQLLVQALLARLHASTGAHKTAFPRPPTADTMARWFPHGWTLDDPPNP